jgi:hypothetical protein
MKQVKSLYLIALLLMLSTNMQGYYKSNMLLPNEPKTNLSVGLGDGLIGKEIVRSYNYYYNSNIDYNEYSSGAFQLKLDHKFTKKFFIGIALGYLRSVQELTGEYAESWGGPMIPIHELYNSSIGILSLRFNYMMVSTKRFEAYFGGGPGMFYSTELFEDRLDAAYRYMDYGGGFFNVSIGARYYVRPEWAIYAEVGTDVSVLNCGVSYRFPTKETKVL